MAKHGIFPRGEGFTVRLFGSTTTHRLGLFALLLLGIFLWIICVVLIMELTKTLIDTLRFIVELGAISG